MINVEFIIDSSEGYALYSQHRVVPIFVKNQKCTVSQF